MKKIILMAVIFSQFVYAIKSSVEDLNPNEIFYVSSGGETSVDMTLQAPEKAGGKFKIISFGSQHSNSWTSKGFKQVPSTKNRVNVAYIKSYPVLPPVSIPAGIGFQSINLADLEGYGFKITRANPASQKSIAEEYGLKMPKLIETKSNKEMKFYEATLELDLGQILNYRNGKTEIIKVQYAFQDGNAYLISVGSVLRAENENYESALKRMGRLFQSSFSFEAMDKESLSIDLKNTIFRETEVVGRISLALSIDGSPNQDGISKVTRSFFNSPSITHEVKLIAQNEISLSDIKGNYGQSLDRKEPYRRLVGNTFSCLKHY